MNENTETTIFMLSPIFIAGTIFLIYLLWKHWPQKPVHEEVLPPPRDPNSIPSPAERQKAVNHLRVAFSHFEDAFAKAKDHNEQAASFYHAARSIVFARSLDPNAQIQVKEDGEMRTYALDELGARILYYESDSNYAHAKHLEDVRQKHISSGIAFSYDGKQKTRRLDRNIAEAARAAVEPAEKAALYQPYNTFYLVHLIRVYTAAGFHQKAQQVLNRALEADPDNVELLKLNQF